MVVDDDPDMRRALTACLDAEGYEVELCEHGRDALERLELGSRPDVIVLDLMMPVLNGLEFLEVLHNDERWSGIRVIVVSATRGYSQEDLGVHCSLEKPFQLEDLFEAIEA